MRRFSAPLIAILLASACLAERYKLTFIPGSLAGEQIELIQHQIETNRKIDHMELFLKAFPEHEASSHFLEWLQIFYSRGKQHPKVIDTGERLLAKHPDDFDAVWRCRSSAEQLNDPALIRKWNDRALQLAAKMLASPKPADIDEPAWQQSLELAKGLLEHAEYEQFTKSLQPTSPREKALALEAFITKYPKSKYAAQVWPHLMSAHRALGDTAKTLSAATKLLANDPTNIDALLLTGQILLEQRSNYAKVQANGVRVLELVAKQPKPQDMTPQEWQKRKDYYIGSANLMIGNTYVNSNNFVMADKHLRAALPYMKGSGQTEGAILFYLGWANYNLEQYDVAAGFFRMCTAFGGQFGEQAARNVSAMKRERRIPE